MKTNKAIAAPVARPSAEIDNGTVPALLQIRSVLVPVDFSPSSEKALAYAVAFAGQFGAKLTLLHVVEPIATPDFAGSCAWLMENDKITVECQRHLERVLRD